MYRNLIVDLNNITFILKHSKVKTPKSYAHKEEHVAAFIMKEVVSYILFFAKKEKIDGIVIACDSKQTWRKDIYPEYKANRDSKDDVYYDEVIEAIGMIQDFFRDYTSAVVIKVDHCEADDIIAVWCQRSTNVENIILSSDKDFMQLLNARTFAYSPQTRKWLESPNPAYDLFIKCIRGDRGDNIRSAYPRVKTTKLQEAWSDKYKLLNLLETVLPDGTTVDHNLEFNMKLIDLAMIPEEISNKIFKAFTEYQPKSYCEFDAMRFMKERGINKELEALFRDKDWCLKKVPKLTD